MWTHLRAFRELPHPLSVTLSVPPICLSGSTSGWVDLCAQWDQCGEMLTEAHMGGMDEMGLFYDDCKQALATHTALATSPHEA